MPKSSFLAACLILLGLFALHAPARAADLKLQRVQLALAPGAQYAEVNATICNPSGGSYPGRMLLQVQLHNQGRTWPIGQLALDRRVIASQCLTWSGLRIPVDSALPPGVYPITLVLAEDQRGWVERDRSELQRPLVVSGGAWTSSAPPVGGPPSNCLSQYGTTACGYGCVAQYGKVKCAQTPQGRCGAQYGQLTCWDPPGPAWAHQGWPQAQCVSQYGKTACGYGCAAQYGEVKCAQTPQGRCTAKYGQVTCWDPR